MTDVGAIRRIVEQAVRDVFVTELGGLRSKVIERVMARLEPALLPEDNDSPTDRLKGAIAAVHEVTAQSDILLALFRGVTTFAPRSAVLLIRGNTAAGWLAGGFQDNEAIRLVTVDITSGLTACAIRQRQLVRGPVAQFEPNFAVRFGASREGDCLLLPLVFREKVAALIYVDAGTQPGGEADVSALEVLVRVASTWIELLALRKSAGAPPAPPRANSQRTPDLAPSPMPAAAKAEPPTPLPKASHQGPGAVKPAIKSSVDDSQPQAAISPEATVAPSPAPVVPVAASILASPGADDELAARARRFAKLLVDEIKLYNQAKVAQGKQNLDLYERLRDDIEKSRATYDKRYAQTPIAANDYFTQELVRNLADNNPSLLGSNFSR